MSPLPPPDHQRDETIRRSGERKARERKPALPETGSSGWRGARRGSGSDRESFCPMVQPSRPGSKALDHDGRTAQREGRTNLEIGGGEGEKGPLKLTPEVCLAGRGQIWAEKVRTGS